MEKKIICLDCKKEFIQKEATRYRRKYCDSCSKKRREEYAKLYEVEFEDCED